jgi:hypothetical protein
MDDDDLLRTVFEYVGSWPSKQVTTISSPYSEFITDLALSNPAHIQDERRMHGQTYTWRIYTTIREKKTYMNTGLLKQGSQLTTP